MAKQLPQVLIKRGVLEWARSSSGWTVRDVADKLKENQATVEAWEEGETPVPFTKLERLADYFKRPVASFFLSKPPETPSQPTDFRYLPNREGIFSKETWLALRRGRRLQGIAAELMDALERTAEADVGLYSLQHDPEQVASLERDRLGVTAEQQRGWRDPYQALRGWREALEQVNVLTFQMKMPVEDARGFSIPDSQPPVVVVTSSDNVQARIFTLMHEYGHILLRNAGVCLPGEETTGSDKGEVERWCDRLAASILMPKAVLDVDRDTGAFLNAGSGNLPLLSRISRRYKVSRLAMLTRLATLGLMSWDRYAEEKSYLPTGTAQGGGFILPPERCIAEKGRAFTSLVFQALDQDVVNLSQTADFLNIRLKHAERVRDLLAA